MLGRSAEIEEKLNTNRPGLKPNVYNRLQQPYSNLPRVTANVSQLVRSQESSAHLRSLSNNRDSYKIRPAYNDGGSLLILK